VPGFASHPDVPDPLLVLDPRVLPTRVADRAFFAGPTKTVARRLLGGWLVRNRRGRTFGARIVEVEAYLGEKDAAAHSYGGRRTPRVEPMYGPGGFFYVYPVYGMHYCANVVTRGRGIPEAVLLRAAEHPGSPPALLRGPAKLCRAFGIVRGDSGKDLVGSIDFEIRLDSAPRREIEASPRIGVDYAGEAATWPLRFFLRNHPAVSGRRVSGVTRRSARSPSSSTR